MDTLKDPQARAALQLLSLSMTPTASALRDRADELKGEIEAYDLTRRAEEYFIGTVVSAIERRTLPYPRIPRDVTAYRPAPLERVRP